MAYWKLARTGVGPPSKRRRLLDEVDMISSVSGGSFTAAYYALYGDQIFTDFDQKFLSRNIQRQMFWRFCSPRNWVRLASPCFNRSDLAAEFYDRQLFHGKTFGDLMEKNRRPSSRSRPRTCRWEGALSLPRTSLTSCAPTSPHFRSRAEWRLRRPFQFCSVRSRSIIMP